MEADADTAPIGTSRLSPPVRGNTTADLLSGSALGLLLGVIVGLATSPVVGIVVGGLVSLLAVFLGLESRGDTKLAILAKVQVNGPRIGAFGAAAVCGVLLGQYVRINNPLVEPPARHLQRWTEAFPGNPVLATQMMLKERLGITPIAVRYDGAAPDQAVTADAGPVPIRPGLMSGEALKALCGDLAPERYNNNVDTLLRRYANEGGAYAAAARRVAELPPAQQWPALAGAHALQCELEAAQAAKKVSK